VARSHAQRSHTPASPRRLRAAAGARRDGATNETAEATEEISLPQPDYDAVDVMVVRRPDQLKALGDDLRARIVVALRERAQSTTELAAALDPRAVITRPFAGEGIRVTVGSPEEDDVFLSALDEVRAAAV